MITGSFQVGGLAAFTKKMKTCLGCKGVLKGDRKMAATCEHCKSKEAEIYATRFLIAPKTWVDHGPFSGRPQTDPARISGRLRTDRGPISGRPRTVLGPAPGGSQADPSPIWGRPRTDLGRPTLRDRSELVNFSARSSYDIL